MIDNGWIFHNSNIGMPFGSDLYLAVYPECLNFLILKVITIFTSNPALVFNIFTFLVFPFTTLISYFVFRRFKLSQSLSIAGGLLYTFAPYHFLRLEHPFLAAYFLVPLAIWIASLIYLNKFHFIRINRTTGKSSFNTKSLIIVIICLIISSTDIYYFFFTCYFFLISGIIYLFKTRRIYGLMHSIILIMIIFIGIVINLSPNMYINYKNPGQTRPSQRSFAEAELYGLKIAQLVLPPIYERISILANLKIKYESQTAFLSNENATSTLGIVGCIGFIILLAWLFYRPKKCVI